LACDKYNYALGSDNDDDDDDEIGGKNQADDYQGVILKPSKQMFF